MSAEIVQSEFETGTQDGNNSITSSQDGQDVTEAGDEPNSSLSHRGENECLHIEETVFSIPETSDLQVRFFKSFELLGLDKDSCTAC